MGQTHVTPLLWLASLSLVGIGVIGIILPAVPGTPLIYIGLLLAAWGDGFQHVSIGTMIFLGTLTLVAFVVDFVSGSLGAKRVGASREAVIGAFLGAIAGIFFGFVGVFFGPFIGAVIGDAKLETEGKADQVEGRVQNAVGSAKDKVKEVVKGK